MKLRREFLKVLYSGLAILQFPELLLAASNPSDFFVICDDSGQPQLNTQNDFVAAVPSFLKLWQFGTEKIELFDLPFVGHSIAQNPTKPSEIAIFSRWGDQSAILNLKDKKDIRIIKEEKNHRFFGHGLYSKDGKRLFTSGRDDMKKTGEIVVRDTQSLKVISRFSAYGRYPYELQFANSESEIVVAVAAEFKDVKHEKISDPHFSENSNFTTIKSINGNFVKIVKLEDDEFSLMHFQISSDGWMVGVGSANERDTSEKKSLAIAVSPAGKIKTLKISDDFQGSFFGETLGVTLFEKKSLVYITNPSNKLILVWNYKTQDLAKYFYIPDRPKAISITSDQKQIIVAETKTKSFLMIDSTKMEIIGRAPGNELSGYGAHLLRLKNFS